MKGDKEYDQHVAESMSFNRWREIKSVFKLNNNVGEPKRGEEGYDPCTKYDLIFKVICHNMNYFTEKAEADFGLDESTWGFSGYMGDAGGRLKNKPVGKGECAVCINAFHFISPSTHITSRLSMLQEVKQS